VWLVSQGICVAVCGHVSSQNPPTLNLEISLSIVSLQYTKQTHSHDKITVYKQIYYENKKRYTYVLIKKSLHKKKKQLGINGHKVQNKNNIPINNDPMSNLKKGTFKRQKEVSFPPLLQKLGQTSLDTRGVGTTDSLNLLAVLEEEESGHSGDTVLGSDVSDLVDINLEELNVLVGDAELLDLRADGLARTAPGGEEIDENGLLGVLDLLGPFSLAGSKLVHISLVFA